LPRIATIIGHLEPQPIEGKFDKKFGIFFISTKTFLFLKSLSSVLGTLNKNYVFQ
jgi:hypothetical protein